VRAVLKDPFICAVSAAVLARRGLCCTSAFLPASAMPEEITGRLTARFVSVDEEVQSKGRANWRLRDNTRRRRSNVPNQRRVPFPVAQREEGTRARSFRLFLLEIVPPQPVAARHLNRVVRGVSSTKDMPRGQSLGTP
jgi:hypothetical protein